ncbi:MAG: circadian clock protein KaiC [Opitutaceae bacterium]|nr:circadian clock protein KaiC [Opitutaceae bacterium]
MKPHPDAMVSKCPTGIVGFDKVTAGGLPRGRTSLVLGGAGSGKTLFALQTLVNGARTWNEPGIFVAFEEDSRRIAENAAKFGWSLPALKRQKLLFIDAQPTSDLVHSGEFDLVGLLAMLETKVRAMKARRIVFDSLDVVLDLMDDPRSQRREIYRLHDWLLRHGLTALLTAKVWSGGAAGRQPFEFMQFMVDCALVLNHDMTQGVSQRTIRVVKYRGSSFAENESPFVIGREGLDVAGPRADLNATRGATLERVSSGIARLDSMLGGGYYRAASVLITGSPGTAKSTLSGAFAAAACRRGERTLFVSFDSPAAEMVRNLASVNINLAGFVRRGLLQIVQAKSGDGSAEAHLQHIKLLAREHRAAHLVVDPISALAKRGNEQAAHSVVERLIDWCKGEGLTVLCTSLLDATALEDESTSMEISTIADTWIHLSYVVHAGERNRALTIVKSRGTSHSNQVRELVLRTEGVTLSDVYTAGGEVLMGTLRWEKEQALRNQRQAERELEQRRARELDASETELLLKLKALERDLANARSERAILRAKQTETRAQSAATRKDIAALRGADAAPNPSPRKTT